jgi:hypothetical protein
VAAYLSSPGEVGGGTEITYTGYERKAITFSPPAAGSAGLTIMNTSDIAFPVAGSAAGTITYFGLMDSLIGGNMWAYVMIDEPIQVNAGVAPLLITKEWHFETIGNFSAGFKAKVLNLLRGIDIPGFTPHVALYNGNPDAGGAELSGGGYERFGLAFGAPETQPSGQSMIANAADVSSKRSTANWGTWAYTALVDAPAGGAVVAFAQEPTPTVMNAGKAVLIGAGAFSVSLN